MEKKSILARMWVYILALGLISSCQDPILVGGDFLDDEKLNVGVINFKNISSQTIAGEKVTTHNPSVDSRTYLLGRLNDPVYGKVSSELFLKFYSQSTLPLYQDETKLRFDSLVLVLQYDTLGTYGNKSAMQSIKVYQLDETISSTDTFDSNKQFKSLPTEIANTTKFVSPKDSIRIKDHLTGKDITLAPQLRIRLNDDFGKALIQNTDAAKNDTIFKEFFKGVYITSTSPSDVPFMYGINLSDLALSSASANKLVMYYTVNDTLEKAYEYKISSTSVNKFVHENSGSSVENFIQNIALGDSISFIQGLGGVKSVIKFNDLVSLDSVLINKAELEIFVADMPGIPGIYDYPQQLIATRKNSEGKFVFVDDFAFNISYISTVFGGNPVSTNNGTKYVLNITNHIKKAVKDPTFDSSLYLNVLTESQNPRRLAMYGAKHSKNPIKLNITYTKK